jgi:hypothetical protein
VDVARRAALLVFAVVCLVAAVRLRRGGTIGVAGPAGVAIAVVTFGLAALGWAPTVVAAIPLLVQYLALSAARRAWASSR